MQPIKFFKLQAKNLHKDYKTQFTYIDGEFELYDYAPKYFDINGIVTDFDLNEVNAENFSLMKAQHIFAMLLDFDKWSDLINAPIKQQELLVLLFKNKFHIEEWSCNTVEINITNGVELTYEDQINILNEHYLGRDTLLNERDTYLIHNF